MSVKSPRRSPALQGIEKLPSASTRTRSTLKTELNNNPSTAAAGGVPSQDFPDITELSPFAIALRATEMHCRQTMAAETGTDVEHTAVNKDPPKDLHMQKQETDVGDATLLKQSISPVDSINMSTESELHHFLFPRQQNSNSKEAPRRVTPHVHVCISSRCNRK